MIKNIQDIPQKEGNLSESLLQVAVACKWLKLGIPAMAGGEMLSDWLEKNKDQIESIFGADDRVYIKTKTPLANKEMIEFIIKNNIGDELQWVKCKEADRWWLEVWWDQEEKMATIHTMQIWLKSQDEPIEYEDDWKYIPIDELNDPRTMFIKIDGNVYRKDDILRIVESSVRDEPTEEEIETKLARLPKQKDAK